MQYRVLLQKGSFLIMADKWASFQVRAVLFNAIKKIAFRDFHLYHFCAQDIFCIKSIMLKNFVIDFFSMSRTILEKRTLSSSFSKFYFIASLFVLFFFFIVVVLLGEFRINLINLCFYIYCMPQKYCNKILGFANNINKNHIHIIHYCIYKYREFY